MAPVSGLPAFPFPPPMNYRPYESHLASSYDRNAQQYRADDEVEVQSANHERLGANLRRICRSFPRPIRVLEIGCGTGRYFHWLQNVELLVGTDISPEMLKHAEQPVLHQEITAREIRLVLGSVYEMSFEAASFDFIYSLGVFGYGAGLTPALAVNLHRWLAPGGRVFFDAIEVPHCPTLRDRVREKIHPWLPRFLRNWVEGRATVPVLRHTRAGVQRVMQEAGFTDFLLESKRCESPLWNGIHVECSARKPESAPAASPRVTAA